MLRTLVLAGLMTGAAGALRADDRPAPPPDPVADLGPPTPFPATDLGPPPAVGDEPRRPPEPPAADPLAERRRYDRDVQTIRWGTPLPFLPDDLFALPVGRNTVARVNGVVRGYYAN